MNKLVIQIIVVTLAGILTIGLSIYSLIDSDKKQKQLDDKQNELSEAQKLIIKGQGTLNFEQKQHALELQSKSDEIIRLQNLLQGKSDIQIGELNRIKNPIPSSFSINLQSTLKLSQIEFDEIKSIQDLKFAKNKTNLMPFDFTQTNEAFNKINALKNVSFEMLIIFSKNGKTLRVKLGQKPMQFMGYHTENMRDVFTLSSQEDSKTIRLDGNQIETVDIFTDYKEPSILDFKNADVSVSYNFFYPQPKLVGNMAVTWYIATTPEYLTLSIESIALETKKYSININNLNKVDSHHFTGKSD